MAELPRTMNLLGVKPAKPAASEPLDDVPEVLEAGLVSSTPEDAMARFREMGNQAKETGALPLDATKIAQALRTLSIPLAPAKVVNETVSPSLQIPAPIFEAAVGLLGGDVRKFPSFVRDAVKAISEGRVAPRKIQDQAAEVARARKAGIGIVKRTVEMPKILFDAVTILSQRSKVSRKATMEACVVLYLQAILATSEVTTQ